MPPLSLNYETLIDLSEFTYSWCPDSGKVKTTCMKNNFSLSWALKYKQLLGQNGGFLFIKKFKYPLEK
jgi:hypothetical protein